MKDETHFSSFCRHRLTIGVKNAIVVLCLALLGGYGCSSLPTAGAPPADNIPFDSDTSTGSGGQASVPGGAIVSVRIAGRVSSTVFEVLFDGSTIVSEVVGEELYFRVPDCNDSTGAFERYVSIRDSESLEVFAGRFVSIDCTTNVNAPPPPDDVPVDPADIEEPVQAPSGKTLLFVGDLGGIESVTLGGDPVEFSIEVEAVEDLIADIANENVVLLRVMIPLTQPGLNVLNLRGQLLGDDGRVSQDSIQLMTRVSLEADFDLGLINTL
ncbi:MAG: hypothetical protein ACPGXK_01380 [Phycisphaerae bacterium]